MDDRKGFHGGGNEALCMPFRDPQKVLSAPSDAWVEDRKLM